MGPIGIDEERGFSVSMRGVVSSTSKTNLRNHLNGNLAYHGEVHTLALAA